MKLATFTIRVVLDETHGEYEKQIAAARFDLMNVHGVHDVTFIESENFQGHELENVIEGGRP